MTATATDGPPAEVLAALADPTRWEVLRLLGEAGEGTATTLAAALPVSRVAVTKHLGVLDRAGLVGSRKVGREVRFRVDPRPLQDAGRRLEALAAAWDARLARLKALAEAAESG
ncbi:ArsR/SmtB family transcription factor [Patulibacter minatonensis]|uniref:ArsR/SmtB family transcription factor n=1 Tax=Patulibacter minatonensis TaxID=298163 RepID=UPI000478AACA|nr:metalloregulator ArsR/SmtB family transcription factor [Patulibacter minatonensis]